MVCYLKHDQKEFTNSIKAPLRPIPNRAAQPSKSILKQSTNQSETSSAPIFAKNKADKRRIKHAQLMSKITKPTTQKPRRRRPNKKLVTTLDSLAEALPDDEEIETAGAAGDRLEQQINIIKRKSIKSRPGAMKRREKIDQSERDRFAKNLAQINASQSNEGDKSVSQAADKWKALRGFIEQTLEKRSDISMAKT